MTLLSGMQEVVPTSAEASYGASIPLLSRTPVIESSGLAVQSAHGRAPGAIANLTCHVTLRWCFSWGNRTTSHHACHRCRGSDCSFALYSTESRGSRD